MASSKISYFAQRNYIITSSFIAAFIGVSVGLYLLLVFSFPKQLMIVFILVTLCAFVFMITGNLRKILLAILILDVPLQFDYHFLYNEKLASIGALGGFNFSITTICLFLLYLQWILNLLLKNDHFPSNVFKYILPMAMYLLFVVLSTIKAKEFILSFFEVSLLFQMLLLQIYIVATVRDRSDVLLILIFLLTGLALESLLMIFLWIKGQSIEIAGVLARIDDGVRVGGTAGSPNNAAAYLNMLIFVSLGVLLCEIKSSYKWLAGIALTLGVIALTLTFSRGGWISFAFSILLFSFYAWYRGWFSLSAIATILIITVLLMAFFFDHIVTRLIAYDQGAAYSRIPLMKLAFRIIIDHPFLGVGANNFVHMIEPYSKSGFTSAWLYVVHNKYLLVWSETGIGGFLTFLWFLGSTIRRGWQVSVLKDFFLAPLGLAILMATIAIMVHMLVDIFNGRLILQILMIYSGLTAAAKNITGYKERGIVTT